MQLLTKQDEEVIEYFNTLNKAINMIEYLLENYRAPLNGEYYLTDKQLSQELKISRRTLQEYRTQGIIPYIQLGGKVLYRESDIQKLLDNAYYPAFK